MSNELDPYKTMIVVKHKGREVGRIPMCAPKERITAYIDELTWFYKKCTVDYERDETAGLMAVLFQPK